MKVTANELKCGHERQQVGLCRGIGFATVQAFLKEGAAVVLCGSRQETADKAVAQLKETDPEVKVEGIWPDLSSLADVQEAFDKAAEKYGRIDVLVNHAGVSESTPFSDYTEKIFQKVMDLNVKGMFNCSKAVEGIMEKQGGGVILNTSSMVSISGQPSGVAYFAFKFAVNGFTVSLARELGPKGTRVNAVASGITATDMMRAVPRRSSIP